MKPTFARSALAAVVAGVFAAAYAQAPKPADTKAPPAPAAQPATPAAAPAAPAGPPIWKQGMPDKMKDSKLAPHAPKMTETPVAEIPLDKLKVPQGFKVEIWASGIPGARMMARNADGTKVWAGTRGIGRVYEVTDKGGKRESRILADKLLQPNGVAFKDGALYVMAIDKVLKYDGIEKNANAQPQDLTAKFNLPPKQHHNWKFLAFGPDGKLYVPVRLALQHLRARAPSTRRFAATTPTAPAWRSWPRACATPSGSTSTRRPRSSGSPTTAATGWATTAPRTS
jgi:glucose/arabinose dehydrogenase